MAATAYQAIKEKLLATGGVVAVVGRRVWLEGEEPALKARPYLIVTHRGTTFDFTFEKVYAEDSRLQVQCWARGYPAAEALAGLVKEALDWQTATVTAADPVSLMPTRYAAEGRRRAENKPLVRVDVEHRFEVAKELA